MKCQPWYPKDFERTLNNTLPEEEVTLLLQKPNCSPRFVYGVLMLPTILKYFIGMDQTVKIDRRMTTPVIVPSREPHAVVEGILVFGLNEHQRNAMYEAEGGLMNLVSVQARIFQSDRIDDHDMRSVRTVDAGAFAWKECADGLIPVHSSAWSIDGFLKSPFYDLIAQSQHRQALDSLAQSSEDSRDAKEPSAEERV
ncbi:uncharacterized protein ATNIH1004_004012 [Aspergillus tanneri]|uniref:Gamma-glutamylcyclotransferase AIG2-like domain-containing protein n=1 Tax=Aspergillus tanneri TaxID=1220188 RepID=A0A5M9MU44_9EURO|nr:uncharacterized protein ATNIH1004_004012 [Aspergillus tanneri]KAA8648129.1 hypothetical protein ATNIH1004_004012 [Aspergillus tanneri]